MCIIHTRALAHSPFAVKGEGKDACARIYREVGRARARAHTYITVMSWCSKHLQRCKFLLDIPDPLCHIYTMSAKLYSSPGILTEEKKCAVHTKRHRRTNALRSKWAHKHARRNHQHIIEEEVAHLDDSIEFATLQTDEDFESEWKIMCELAREYEEWMREYQLELDEEYGYEDDDGYNA